MHAHNNSSNPKINLPKSLTKNWYVIYTKPRHEKKVLASLIQHNIEAFCPMKTTQKIWSDRKKFVELPLFNSYCFVYLAEVDLKSVFKVPGVVRYIYWCGKPAVVRDTEIGEIKRWLNEFDHNYIEVLNFKKNEIVNIQSGSFLDCMAVVKSSQGNALELVLEGLGIVLRAKANQIILKKVS